MPARYVNEKSKRWWQKTPIDRAKQRDYPKYVEFVTRMQYRDPDAYNMYVWGTIDPYSPLWKIILKWIGIGVLVVTAVLVSLFVLTIVTHGTFP